MNKQEAITRAEAWYLQRYHAVAHGHLSLDVDIDEQALSEVSWCIDLVPEQATEVVRVLLDLAGEDVVLLEEGRLCPRCIRSMPGGHLGGSRIWRHWGLRWWGQRRQHSA